MILFKLWIAFLFIAMVASLFMSFSFLRKDVGDGDSKRALRALGVRVTLAALLLGSIAIGFYSGFLKSKAPWDYSQSVTPRPNS